MATRQSITHSTKAIAAENRPRWAALAMGLALVAATFVAYFPAIRAGFVWDDKASLYENTLIKADNGLYKFWFTTEATDYWPLSATTFWIEWRIWRGNPTPYHVANIALHALAAVILWRILKRLGIGGLGAFLGGLLFAIHPVTVESVAWITERKNVLSMVLYLLSIYAYLQFEDHGNRRWYILALLAAAAALLAKASVVAIPVVLLLLIWWQQKNITQRDLIRTSPFFLISLILGLATVWFQQQHAIGDAVVRPEGIASRIASVGWIVWFYLYKIVAPINLVMIYPRWDIDGRSVLSYVPLTLLLAFLAVLWHYRKSWSRGPLVAIGSFIIVLAPVLGLLDMAYLRYSLVADHLQYAGMPGIMALIGSGMAAAWSWAQRKNTRAFTTTVATAITAVFIALIILTWRQTLPYRDDTSLWTYTIKHNNRAWAAHNNLGNCYEVKGDYDQAIKHYTNAIEAHPNYPESYYNRGKSYGTKGDYDQAIRDYDKAIELEPAYSAAYNSRGAAYETKDNYDQAIQDYNKAIEFMPSNEDAYCNRGNAYSRKGNHDLAIRDFDKAIELKPELAVAYNIRGNSYGAKGNYDQAIRDYSKAIQLQTDNARFYNNRGAVYSIKGDFPLAIQDCDKAIGLMPNYARGFFTRGTAFGQMGDHARAIGDFTKAIELEAGYAQAYHSRATAFFFLKQYDKVWADIKKCRQLGMTPNPGMIDNLVKESGRTE